MSGRWGDDAHILNLKHKQDCPICKQHGPEKCAAFRRGYIEGIKDRIHETIEAEIRKRHPNGIPNVPTKGNG